MCWTLFRRPVISQGAAPVAPRNLIFAVQPEIGPRQHALRDGPWKLVRIGQAPSPVESLLQVEDDPNEKQDVIQAHPEVASRLRKMMDDWITVAPTGEASYSLEPHPGWVTPKDWAKVAVE